MLLCVLDTSVSAAAADDDDDDDGDDDDDVVADAGDFSVVG